MKPYPLLLQPILKEKVWGGRRLERLGKRLPDAANVGESWELADLAATSADGGGGDSARSVVAHGEMRGLTITQAITAMGVNVMGTLRLSEQGGFPLLLKYLDARENLSVQVHPSPAYAAAHPGAHLKTESWYVVAAEPGAKIYKGLRPGLTRDSFAQRVQSGQVVEDLIAFEARAGDFHHLPSGTLHALGAGVLVAEVQTPSDTTFRVFDWGRTGRALHMDAALECIDFASVPAPPVNSGEAARMELVSTPFYTVTEINQLADVTMQIDNFPSPPTGGPMAWMVIEGEGAISSDAGHFRETTFRRGDTMLFPAAMAGASCGFSRDSKILEIRFPPRATP